METEIRMSFTEEFITTVIGEEDADVDADDMDDEDDMDDDEEDDDDDDTEDDA